MFFFIFCRYSQCIDFTNNAEVILEHEVIIVTCSLFNKKIIIYEDAYAILKKISINNNERNEKATWNVLILGMDTMSRARIYASMPKTVAYFQQNDWLDYKGYQKVKQAIII